VFTAVAGGTGLKGLSVPPPPLPSKAGLDAFEESWDDDAFDELQASSDGFVNDAAAVVRALLRTALCCSYGSIHPAVVY
jgi:hypothetical protein